MAIPLLGALGGLGRLWQGARAVAPYLTGAAIGATLNEWGDIDEKRKTQQAGMQPQQSQQKSSALDQIIGPQQPQQKSNALDQIIGPQQPQQLQQLQPSRRSEQLALQQALRAFPSGMSALGNASVPPLPVARDPEYAAMRQSILKQIEHGLTTNIPGQRLTADGLAQLTGLLRVLDEPDTARYAATARYVPEMSAIGARSNAAYIAAMNSFITPPEELETNNPAAAKQYTQDRLNAWFTASSMLGKPEKANALANYLQTLRAQMATATPEERAQMERDWERGTNILAAYYHQVYGRQPMPVQTQRYADGGLVQGFAPSIPQLAAIQQYQSYAQMMQRLGLKPVPFEAFVRAASQQQPQLQPQATPRHMQVMGYADGGIVSRMLDDPRQVDGKLVIDPMADGERDTIPAVVDETAPAKLDSGEMVLPRDVVLFYGTDRLSKMIEKARTAQGAVR